MNLKIILISFTTISLNKLIKKIITLIHLNNLNVSGPIYMPKKKLLFNILKSPHINKDSRDQLILFKIKCFLIIKNINKKFLKKLMLINLSPLIYVKIKTNNENK